MARLHHVAADPAQLCHALGWAPNHAPNSQDFLLAAKHLGLKATLTRSSPERLALTPLPALALIRDEQGDVRTVVLAQCDGQRVLFQDPTGAIHGGRPVIQPFEAFKAVWTGKLILITSRASLAGELARFDFSWFIPSLVKYRRLLGEVLVISLFLQLFGLVSPLFFQVVMDKVLVHRGLTTLDVLVAGLIIVVLYESLLSMLRTYVFSHTTSRIDVELGARLFRHLLQLPLAYFQARRVGDSVARVRELENIRSFLTGNSLTLVLDVMFSVIFIAVMFVYSVPLTLIVLISLPLYVTLSLLVVPVLRARLNEKFARGAENQALLVETVTGVQTAKASALEPAIAKRWDDQLAAYVSASFKTQTLATYGHEGINLIGKLVSAATLWYGAKLVMDQQLSVGQFVAFNYVVNVATDVVTELANEGIDTVQSSATLTLANNVENLTLTGTSPLSGIGNALDNMLIGTSASNVLIGLAGNDTLDGGAGSDAMFGGTGNDLYIVDRATDVVTELAGEGADTVQSAVTLTLAANVENLTLTGSASIDGTGNSLNNVLIGNSGVNALAGAAGDDTYDGGAGNDTFTDTSTTSNDTYRWGTGAGLDALTDSGGALDHVDLFAGITSSQLRFAHVGNNLELTLLGNSMDKLTINGWYAASSNQIEEFRLSDGSRVLASQVDSLISAMATFSAGAHVAGPTMTFQPVRSASELTTPAIA